MKKALKNSVLRPVRIKIPNTLYDPSPEGQEHKICLFSRTSDKVALNEELERNPIAGLTKIISLDEVKKYYKQFHDRKKLFKEFTHFLCDNRIFSHVINLLGKVFSTRNNHPVPVDISNINKLQAAVDKAVNQSTYMHPSGPLLSIRFGMTNMSSKKIIQNIIEGLKVVFEKLNFGLGSINSIHLKSSDSPALPIHYSHQNEISEFLKTKVSKKSQRSSATSQEDIDAPTSTINSKKKKTKTADAPVIETIRPFSNAATADKKSKNKVTQESAPETSSVASVPDSDTVSMKKKKKAVVVSEPVESVQEEAPVGKKRAKATLNETEVSTSAPAVEKPKKLKLRK